MRTQKRIPAALGLAIVLAMIALGCSSGSDTNTAATSGGSSSSGSSSSGGDVTDNGKPSTETVSAGEVSKSPKYKMVFTLGQPTQNQDKTTSPSYNVQGGLQGAIGSAK